MKTIVVAVDKNNAIGFKNDLPWGRSLPSDLANFKKLTLNGSVIMGRKTFESIGSKPLDKRENIVLSSKPTGVPGVLTADSLKAAYALARYPIFVIGGESVYQVALPDIDVIYMTQVDAVFENADVFFDKLDETLWLETERVHYTADEKNKYSFDIIKYERRS